MRREMELAYPNVESSKPCFDTGQYELRTAESVGGATMPGHHMVTRLNLLMAGTSTVPEEAEQAKYSRCHGWKRFAVGAPFAF